MKLVLPLILATSLFASAGEPPQNTIPILGVRINRSLFPELEGVALEHLIMLSWRYFDGVDAWGWAPLPTTRAVTAACDSLGMSFVLLSSEMGQFIQPAEPNGLWFRWPDYELDDAQAFAKVFAQSGEADWDSLCASFDGPTFYDTLPERQMALLGSAITGDTPGREAYWFLGLWDEGNTNQRANMMAASGSQTLTYKTYFPDIFTQTWSQESPPTPTMEEIDPEGVFSWLKWAYDQTEDPIPVTTTLGTLLTYSAERYPGLPGDSDLVFGTLADMGRCVGAIRDMQFTYPEDTATVDNSMDFICFNRYTYRQVEIRTSTTMCDSCWRYLIELCEESMDTVVANAGEMPVYFYAQLFGGFGGPAMREAGDLYYQSLMYRQPSIAEFRMLCNLALLHQMKGIFPYCVRSFHELPGDTTNDWIAGALLDWNLIPFDAPYEDWVYSGRLDEDVCSPESIPPFQDTPVDYDPLFDLPPAPSGGGQRQQENISLWKFDPFANIWNGIGNVLGEVKMIGPEIRNLWWYDGYEDAAMIEDTSSTIPAYWTVAPVIKVFTDAGENSCYLYYLNRQCRENDHDFVITGDEDDFPEGALTAYALDHHRRFIIPVSVSNGVYTILDTLDAGQGRLVQFISGASAQADARLTEPDISASAGAGTTQEYRFTAGDQIRVFAEVFNMLTTARRNVSVTLYDITEDSTLITSDVIDLPALSTSGYETASDTAELTWSTNSADIGAHLLEIRVAKWAGEPDTTDNWARVAFLIDPRDYSTEILGDPWDMKEATLYPPDWKTADIDSLLRWDTSAWTDSISGMFEGRIASAYFSSNRMYLHMPTSSGQWIDGDLYNQFSLTGKSSADSTEVTLGWIDSHGSESSALIDTITTTYGRTDPVDLSDLWSGDTIKKIWLRFDPISTTIVNVRVRIGRIWLEEAKP